ncbi:MAG: hypothetical protein EYC70_14995 [Planctomycetota bacterium]|nr:MAG: hypothetical protein EYC70_14995 [Planctomycetota bacterium]
MPLPLLLLLLPAAQEPASPAAASDPQAEALFQRVAAAQLAGGEPTAVEGFRVQLTLLERAETRREIDLLLLYRQEGGHIRMSVTDSQRGARVEKGFDGQRYWLRDENQVLQDLGAREFARDRAALDDARKLCEELLLLMDLRRLREHARGLSLEDAAEDRRILRGRWDRNGAAWGFALQLAPDLTAEALELTPPPPKEGEAALPRQRYQLSAPTQFEDRRMPQVIEEFHDDEREYFVRRIEVHKLQWRRPPSPAELAAESPR